MLWVLLVLTVGVLGVCGVIARDVRKLVQRVDVIYKDLRG